MIRVSRIMAFGGKLRKAVFVIVSLPGAFRFRRRFVILVTELGEVK